jgi:hypothetical protein
MCISGSGYVFLSTLYFVFGMGNADVNTAVNTSLLYVGSTSDKPSQFFINKNSLIRCKMISKIEKAKFRIDEK